MIYLYMCHKGGGRLPLCSFDVPYGDQSNAGSLPRPARDLFREGLVVVGIKGRAGV